MLNVTIETARLTLRKPKPDDAVIIFSKWAQDKEVTKYLVWKPHNTIEDTKKFIEFCIAKWNSCKLFTYVICRKEDNEIIGMIDAKIENFKVNFGYVLAKQYWNKGYMSEALKKLSDEVLKIDNIYRAWAFCDHENTGSVKVMEKAGMKFEGILKKWTRHLNISKKPRDCLVYSKVKE